MGKIFRFIPSLDCIELDKAMEVAQKTAGLDEVYGFKVGFSLGLANGLKKVIEEIKALCDKPVIYDHQKAATDIPDTGVLYAQTMKYCGVDEAILFPQAGPETLKAWIKALHDESIKVIGGGIMTHPAYLVSEGGFLDDSSPEKMYSIARDAGVKTFVAPLTKPDKVRDLVEKGVFGENPEVYSPGYGAQNGDPTAFSFITRHMIIVGRSLFRAEDPVIYLRAAAEKLNS